jgi:hypothetical protein
MVWTVIFHAAKFGMQTIMERPQINALKQTGSVPLPKFEHCEDSAWHRSRHKLPFHPVFFEGWPAETCGYVASQGELKGGD